MVCYRGHSPLPQPLARDTPTPSALVHRGHAGPILVPVCPMTPCPATPARSCSRPIGGSPQLKFSTSGPHRAHTADTRLHTGFSQGSHRLLTGFLQGSHRVLTGFSQGSYRLLTGFSQGSHRVLTGFLQGSYRVRTGFSQGSHRVLTGVWGHTAHKGGHMPPCPQGLFAGMYTPDLRGAG